MAEASQSSLTPATAPRDLTALTSEGMFKLRMLLTKLGKLSTEDEMMSWHSLKTNEARAAHVLEHLKEWDKANTSPTSATLTPTRQPATSASAAVQQMLPMNGVPTAGAGPAAVDPSALAAAAAATSDKPKTRRAPVTAQTHPPDTDPAQVGSMLVENITKLLDTAGTTSRDIGKIGSAVVGSYEKLEIKISDLSNQLTRVEQLLGIFFAMELSARQETAGASLMEILQAATADRANLDHLMQQASSGKAR